MEQASKQHLSMASASRFGARVPSLASCHDGVMEECKSNKTFFPRAAFGHGVYLSNGKQTKTDGINLDERGKNKNKNNSQNWQDIAAEVVADRGGEICCGWRRSS